MAPSKEQSGAPVAADSELVERCLRGEQRAWETLVCTYAKSVFNMSYRFTGCKEEAQDLTQEVFLHIYRRLGSFRAESGSFRCWALKVSRNVIIDHFRRERRHRGSGGRPAAESLDAAHDMQAGPEAGLERAEAFDMLRAALRALPPPMREAVILRDMEGLDYREISQVLGVREGTVKSRINRARTVLARTLSRRPEIAAAMGL